MGDKTQFATVALATHFQAPVRVILGPTLGMQLADVPAIWLGDRLAQRAPMRPVRITAVLLFVAMGALALLGLLREAP
jgi:putative Ca2+/H+ antiporter (TMEM165/GDT1 family)